MSDEKMRLVIVGPGRAGGSLALAAQRAGHEIAGVLGRRGSDSPNEDFGPSLTAGTAIPDCDALLVCVRDDQVENVVDSLVGRVDDVAVVAHVSGFLPTTILAPLATSKTSIGGFHPLQTLPDPERGSTALAGAHAGIEGDSMAFDTLTHLALSLGMKPFRLDDSVRPTYHAAAAAAANFVVTSLVTSADLFDAARVDPAVAQPLVEAVVRNAFEAGGRSALTGPIARGDTETVIGHLLAAHEVSDDVGQRFRLLAEATAILAGRFGEVRDWK